MPYHLYYLYEKVVIIGKPGFTLATEKRGNISIVVYLLIEIVVSARRLYCAKSISKLYILNLSLLVNYIRLGSSRLTQ